VKKLANRSGFGHLEGVKAATVSLSVPRGPAADHTLTGQPTGADLAARIEAGFRQAANQAIQDAHAAELAVPVLGSDGRAAWLHPDGAVISD
jgi:hypothetical protein